MLRILRITLMWLIALAVPVQGFAAASMVGCGSGHGAAGAHSHALGMHEHPAGTTQHSHDADDQGPLAMPAHHHAADGPGHGDTLKTHDAGKFTKASCSACASCCTSAALPSTMVVFEATHVRDSFVQLAPLDVSSFVTDGPERPPRSVLA